MPTAHCYDIQTAYLITTSWLESRTQCLLNYDSRCAYPIHIHKCIMTFVKNRQKKGNCAFFISIPILPALLWRIECLPYYNHPLKVSNSNSKSDLWGTTKSQIFHLFLYKYGLFFGLSLERSGLWLVCYCKLRSSFSWLSGKKVFLKTEEGNSDTLRVIF